MRQSICVLILVLGMGRVCAQVVDSDPKRNRNNSFEINFALHEFFDGNPVMQTKYRGAMGWTNLSYGLGYTRSLGNRHGVGVSCRVVSIEYYDVFRNPKPPGWVFLRSAYLFDLLYSYQLGKLKQSELYGLGGINYRHGDEFQVVSYGPLDMLMEFYPLRDIGITGGLRGVQLLPWNFQVSGEVKYTFYVYRHTKPREYMRPYTDGTTRHLLTMQLGIGYRF